MGYFSPKGKRYVDGKIHTFYTGFARLAQKLKRPIIPVLLLDVHKVFSSRSWIINCLQGPIKIVIGRPMMIKEGESLKAFCDKVRIWFLESNRKYKHK